MKRTPIFGFTELQPFSGEIIGKSYELDHQDKIKKSSHSPSKMKAIYKEFNSPREFYEEITRICNTQNRAIMLDKPKGIGVNETFYIFSTSELDKSFGGQNHRGNIYKSGTIKCIGRLKENFEAVDIFLLDYDGFPNNSNKKPYQNEKELIDDLDSILGGLKSCSYILTTSSSCGIQKSNVSSTINSNALKYHIYLFVTDGSDKHQFKERLKQSAALEGMLWPNNGKGVRNKTIVDDSTLSSSRLIFEGSPILGKGIEQNRMTPQLNLGEIFDPASMRSLSADEDSLLASKLGLRTVSTYSPKTQTVTKRHSIHTENSYFPELTNRTKYIEFERNSRVREISEYKRIDGDWIPIVSELRCDINIAHLKNSASEYLFYHDQYGPCIYEHDGSNTYMLPPRKRSKYIESLLQKQCTDNSKKENMPPPSEDFFGSISYQTVPIDLSVQITPKSRHLWFGAPGQGKSRSAYELARTGKTVLFVSSSNEQSEEQHNNCQLPSQLLLSKKYRLEQETGIKATLHDSANIWEAPELDIAETAKSLVDFGIVSTIEKGEEYIEEIESDVINLFNYDVIFLTLDKLKIIAKNGYFDDFQETIEGSEVLNQTVIFFDDIEYDKLTNHSLVDQKMESWIVSQESVNLTV